ncbi:hypothetical protein RISK_006508 [Rhodopirellula islandica]|uniref:Uncharacterized protein n=1 Tax=Rhodopirellula islandica TaxID=595434 RepID=A0A0J1B3J8_RHOIS|nr:hypothetical protein RISK_006508 [Rhodopirellula islandica]
MNVNMLPTVRERYPSRSLRLFVVTRRSAFDSSPYSRAGDIRFKAQNDEARP